MTDSGKVTFEDGRAAYYERLADRQRALEAGPIAVRQLHQPYGTVVAIGTALDYGARHLVTAELVTRVHEAVDLMDELWRKEKHDSTQS